MGQIAGYHQKDEYILWEKEKNNFTAKEKDILACLLYEKTSKKVAALLEMTPKNVDTHIFNMTHKLGFHSRNSLIDLIEKYGDHEALHAHYSQLLRVHNFNQAVQKTAAHTRGQHITCKVLCEDEGLHDKMIYHLKKVGISVLEEGVVKTVYIALSPETLPEQGFDTYSDHPFNFSILYTGNDEALFFEIVYHLCPSAEIKEALEYFKCGDIIDHYGHGSYYGLLRHLYQAHPWNIPRLGGIIVVFLLCFSGVLFIKMVYNKSNIFSTSGSVNVHSVFTIPADSRRLDRQRIIIKIDEVFQVLKNKNGIQTVVLFGIGGAGKTTLARQYAHRQHSNIVWEINAENDKTVLSSFELLAYALSKTPEEKKELDRIKQLENIKEYAQRLLVFIKQKMQLQKKWFLIFDNVNDFSTIESFFPYDLKAWGQGQILITTRNHHMQDHHQIQKQAIVVVGALNEQEQMTLFMKIIHTADSEVRSFKSPFTTKKLEQFLSCLPPFPLDIESAAQYIKNAGLVNDEGLDDYLKKLVHMSDDFEKTQHALVKKMTNYDKTRYSIIGCMMQHLLEVHPEFANLLFFISMMGSQHMPQKLLVLYPDQALAQQFIKEMCAYALFSRQKDGLSIHRSMQHNIFTYLKKVLSSKKQQEAISQCLQMLESYSAPIMERADVTEMRAIAYHLQSILEKITLLNNHEHSYFVNQGRIELLLGDIYGALGDPIPAKNLLYASINHLPQKDSWYLRRALTRTGSAEKDCANYDKAKVLLEQSLSLHDQVGDSDPLELALTLCNLSYVYRFTTEYDKAKIAIERAIALYKKYEPNGLNFALALSELALFYNYSNGDYKRAIQERLKSLALVEKICGSTHLKTILVKGLLGMDLRGAGYYQEALDTFKASYAIYKAYYPMSVYHVLWITSNVGMTYNLLGCYVQARSFLEDACQISKKYFGKDHIHTQWSHIALGQLYLETGKVQEARSLLEESLKAHIKQFGAAHYKIGSILHLLGIVYTQLGLYREAQNCFEKSLTIYQKKYGLCHPDYALILKDQGWFYSMRMAQENKEKRSKDFDTAEILIKQALSVFEGEKHPEAYRCYEYLGLLYDKQGKKAVSIIAYRKALQILQTYFPKESAHRVRITKALQRFSKC